MNRSLYSLSLFTILFASQLSFANKDLFEAALAGKWDKFWGIRLKDPTADLDYSEDGVSVRDLVEAAGYFDLLDPIERPVYERPRLIPPTVQPSIATRTRRAPTLPPADHYDATPMEIDEARAWMSNSGDFSGLGL